MSSSSVTACSRSPSPVTPDTSEIPDTKMSLKSWRSTVPPNVVGPSLTLNLNWALTALNPPQNDDEEAISFHDFVRETVFDSSAPAENPSTFTTTEDTFLNHSPLHMAQLAKITTPETINVLPTKPTPPPHPVQHVANVVHNVVCPPQDSCSNLPIVFPSIPETGAKSRVETQVRITVDLAHASSSQGPFLKYDRVGSWKCLKLPPNTSTKRRTRKEGKLDAAPQETLQLTVEVTCSSSPHMRVAVCSSCQSREAKRAARKVTSRVKPNAEELSSEMLDPSLSLLQFNCPEELDFSTGSVVLPMRITCYCRHHREKVGFNVHFKMVDHTGRIVGSGSTPPIMITDDHKSIHKSQPLPHSLNPSNPTPGWDGSAVDVPRKQAQKSITVKKRAKPYDPSTRKKSLKDTKVETSSPSAISSVLPTRASSPVVTTQPTTPALSSTLSSPKPPFDSLAPPTDFISGIYGQSEIPMPDFNQTLNQTLDPLEFTQATSSIPSPSDPTTSPEVAHAVAVVQQPEPQPAMFFNFDPSPPIPPFQLPKIHRLIPSAGPTHGGIEVTVLGANFHAHIPLNCVFGEMMASSTQRWSDNTLVCVLPARATPGVVAVWFDGIDVQGDGTPPCLFTYTDESDRGLMELALQVVGMKLNGKLEDPRSVAMRIIGTAGGDGSSSTSTQQSQGGDGGMQYQLSTAVSSLRPLLFARGGDGEQLQKLILDFLMMLDVDTGDTTTRSTSSVISHQTNSGQTLLHLASFLNYSDLASFLITRGIDMDARDRNGCTALHFAALSGSKECARLLLIAGADMEIVNVLGKTPVEVATDGFFESLVPGNTLLAHGTEGASDDEATWGDVEDEEDSPRTKAIFSAKKLHRKSFVREGNPMLSSGLTPPSPMIRQESEADDPPVVDPSISKVSKEPKDTKTKADAKDKGGKSLKEPFTDKATATIIDLIYRTLTQLQHPQGIIPNVAQQVQDLRYLQLPGMGALQQVPAVFPVFVPIPAWLWSDGARREGGATGPGELKGAAPQLKSIWEKLVLTSGMVSLNANTTPPPPYEEKESTAGHEQDATTPNARTDTESQDQAGSQASTPVVGRRQVHYPDGPAPPEEEVNSYGYRRAATKAAKVQKKHDRMLIIFWIPILLLGFFWMFIHAIWASISFVKDMIPLRGILGV